MDDHHLTEEQIARFGQRNMSRDELLAADAHLAGCRRCRAAATNGAAGAATVESVQAGLRSGESRAAHLEYGELAAFVDGTLGEVEREIVESHLAVCAECKADWIDLDLFRKSLTAPDKRTVARDTSSRWRVGLPFRLPAVGWTPLRIAGALACVAVVVWLGSVPFRSRTVLQTAQVGTLPSGEAARHGADVPTPGIPVVELRDGDGTVALNSDGSLSGFSLAAPAFTESAKAVLGGGRLRVPEDVAALAGRTGVLLGEGETRPRFGILSPVGTAVVSDRPTLRWRPLNGATHYEVSVYDAAFVPVAVSPHLRGTEWIVARRLTGGGVYSWQVKAFTDDQEVLSPKPPEPEARFKVLDRKPAEELLRMQLEQPRSHLTLGILFASAGALEDAAREFTALAAANPRSPIPQRLLRELKSASADVPVSAPPSQQKVRP